MENPSTWREAMEKELRMSLKTTDGAIRAVFLYEQSRGTIDAIPCGHCHITFPRPHLTALACGHVRCQECLRTGISNFLEPKHQLHGGGSQFSEADVVAMRRHFVICEQCFKHSVVVQTRRSFEPTISQFPPLRGPPPDSIPDLVVDRQLTEAVAECVREAVYYQNERYNLFGRCYSAKYIMGVDFRTPMSDDNHCPVDPAVDYVLPNSSWRWANDWAPYTVIGDEQGWQYAINWPEGAIPGPEWHDSSQFSDLVRRRKMVRVMICFNSLVADYLLRGVDAV